MRKWEDDFLFFGAIRLLRISYSWVALGSRGRRSDIVWKKTDRLNRLSYKN